MLRTLAASTLLVGLATSVSAAQDFSERPLYGSVELRAGFTGDPRTVSLRSGGSNDASETVGRGCVGYVANAPDYRINYTAGSLPLIISVNANADTTLVINGPDGRWHCDDDSGEGTNPSYRFASPQSGQYDIWVGTYSSSQTQQATLYISELYSQ